MSGGGASQRAGGVAASLFSSLPTAPPELSNLLPGASAAAAAELLTGVAGRVSSSIEENVTALRREAELNEKFAELVVSTQDFISMTKGGSDSYISYARSSVECQE